MKPAWAHFLKKQRGLTIIEVLVALLVASLLAGVITFSIFQMLKLNERNSHNITAQRQVQQVGYYISRDVLMSQTVTRVDTSPAGSGFPVILKWVDITDNKSYRITYSLSGGVIDREQVIVGGATTNIKIANYVSAISFFKTGIGFYSLNVTATVPGSESVSETRTYEIMQRTG